METFLLQVQQNEDLILLGTEGSPTYLPTWSTANTHSTSQIP